MTFAPFVEASFTSFLARRRFAVLSAVVASCIKASRNGLNAAGIKLITLPGMLGREADPIKLYLHFIPGNIFTVFTRNLHFYVSYLEDYILNTTQETKQRHPSSTRTISVGNLPVDSSHQYPPVLC
jgi:hypothetical protein